MTRRRGGEAAKKDSDGLDFKLVVRDHAGKVEELFVSDPLLVLLFLLLTARGLHDYKMHEERVIPGLWFRFLKSWVSSSTFSSVEPAKR